MDVIYILWLRQVRRFFRSGVRVLLGFMQPLVYMLALGYGLNAVFQSSGNGSYIQFIVPGIMVQVILFTSMFWGANVVWDRQFGFLKETLVSPVSRLKIIIGSALGGVTVSLFQGVVLFIISVAVGFRPYNWYLVPVAILFMSMLSMAIVGFSAGVGAMVDEMQGFVAVNNFLVIPLFFLSSSLFPLDHVPAAMKIIAEFNPISYAVDALRTCLINRSHFGLVNDFLVLLLTMCVTLFFGTYRFMKIQA
ncbi:MAG TPA: ABC transporter permease [Bacteroidia bacterium]|jgi:ABC-2 type transport system permease protein|nr:ABC transporter permease [Bacteroidia bacterium]